MLDCTVGITVTCFKCFRGITLEELLRTLEDHSDAVPNCHEYNIAIMPPTNATQHLTDEDSGEEDSMTINNLPRLLLLAEADIVIDESDMTGMDNVNDNHWDDEDDIPLHYFSAPKKQYRWVHRDLLASNVVWPTVITATNAVSSATELF